MDNLNNILKKMMKISVEKKNSPECLSEEFFAAYLNNLLTGSDKEKVENHLYECSACRKQSIVLSRVTKEIEINEVMKAPGKVTEKAKQLTRTKSARNIYEVVLDFAKDSIKILKDTGAMFTPLDLAVAGARHVTSGEMNKLVHLSKVFNEIKANITIERIDDEKYEINVKTFDNTNKKPLNGLRINLLSGGRELASFITVDGQVAFKNLLQGNYELNIIKEKEEVANILLKLENEK